MAGRHAVAAPLSPKDLTLHLRVLQVTLFAALEVGERAAAGVPVSSILSQRVFLLGIAFQLLIAPVLALLVRLLGAAARAAGRAARGEAFLRAPLPVSSAPPMRRRTPTASRRHRAASAVLRCRDSAQNAHFDNRKERT